MTDQMQPQPPKSRTSFAGLVVDVAGATGAALIVHGVDMIHRPSAFIVAGLFLLAGAWHLARKGV